MLLTLTSSIVHARCESLDVRSVANQVLFDLLDFKLLPEGLRLVSPCWN